MNRIFYAERDTTLYEKYPEQNTGIDQILELTKIASGSKLNGVIQANTYNTRFIVDFGTQIDILRTAINNGEIPALNLLHPKSSSAFISITAADASDLLHSYTIQAFPVSESWVNGNGNYSDNPIQKYGASWYYRDSADIGTYWDSGSSDSGVLQASTTEILGGGAWITSSAAKQNFKNESPDIRIDVTNIIKYYTEDAEVLNNGIIFKRTTGDELSSEVLGSIKFFGRESHTIFVPRLEILFDDTQFVDTSSAEIASDTYVPYIKNIKAEYRTSEITKFRVGVRPEFPNKAFQTSSFYLTEERLPTSSFYSILDSVTNESIIPFDSLATKIDCDANGSFFKLRMDSFMPERFYKVMLKIERDGGNDVQTFDDFYFKVVN
jgi:hypothetical protein